MSSHSGINSNAFSSSSGLLTQAKLIPIVSLTASATLSASQSGSLVRCATAGGAIIVTLPAPSQGLNYKICKSDASPNTVTVTATGTLLYGSLIANGTVITNVNQSAQFLTNCQGKTSIVTPAVDCTGSFVDLVSDGVRWYCTGCASLADALAVGTGMWATA